MSIKLCGYRPNSQTSVKDSQYVIYFVIFFTTKNVITVHQFFIGLRIVDLEFLTNLTD